VLAITDKLYFFGDLFRSVTFASIFVRLNMVLRDVCVPNAAFA